MHTYNIHFKSKEQFNDFALQKQLKEFDDVLIQVFSSELDVGMLLAIRDDIVAVLPKAELIGTTTDGEFIGSEVTTDKTVVSISVFEKTKVKTALIPLTLKDSFLNGKHIATTLIESDTKALILFSDGLNTNGEAFLRGVQTVSHDTIVAGGMAGDAANFVFTLVFTKNEYTMQGSVGASLQSDDLIVHNKLNFNWESIGKTMTVTKSEENRVYSIDNQTPVAIYSKYLGESMGAALPAVGIEFPLIINRNGIEVARAALAKGDDDSLTFAGNVQEGDQVRLGFGNIEMILDSSKHANQDLQNTPIESIFIYSCMARRRFLKDMANIEFKDLENIAPVSGFFTYGEFFTSSQCELLNQTMTTLLLSESKETPQKHFESNSINKADPTLKALSHLINVTSKEMQDLSSTLEENVAEKTSELQKKVLELERATKSKSDFLANMSHEIRTPLNAIIGFIDLLSKNEKDSQKLKQFGIIERSGESLLTIINDILDFSKLESGSVAVESIPFATKQPFLDICELFYERSKENKIDFTYNFKDDIESFSEGDPLRIRQIVSNLLSNAIKFTPEDGEVTLCVKYDQNKTFLVCDIKDTGIGIEADKLEHIFDHFTQADNSTTRKYGGTGLGLAISKKLATLMGGDLTVKSTINKGSTFTLTIPQRQSNIKIIPEKVEEFEYKNITFDAKILLVEDNATNRMLIHFYFDALGLRYEDAVDGVEAVEKYRSGEHYDLILMDENMPNMNGIEATQKIREYEKVHDLQVPIIALTANALAGDKERFLEAGMDEYLAKPVTQDQLAKMLAKLLPYT